MRTTSCSLSAIVAFVTGGAALAAQEPGRAVFRGVVTTDYGARPVADAEVVFREASRSVRTGKDGRFVVAALAAGSFTVLVRSPGYKPITGTVKLAATDTLDYKFDLVPLPGTRLSPVEVTTSADSARIELRDFVRRRSTTNGKFITDQEILRLGSTNLANVIRTKVSGFDLVQHPSTSGTALASRRGGFPGAGGLNTCYTSIWINGQLFYEPTKAEQPPRLEDFNMQEIAAIEFYRVSEVPPELQFRSGNCGAVVLWTMVPRRRTSPPG